jgi:hypothetical protein
VAVVVMQVEFRRDFHEFHRQLFLFSYFPGLTRAAFVDHHPSF